MRFPAAIPLLALAAASALFGASCSSGTIDKDFQFTPEEKLLLQPLPDTTPRKVRSLVEQGDELFAQATPAYRRADPESGADWESRNAMAFDLYTRARASYVAAQAESGLMVPPPILDRSKECLTRLVALRKMKRSAPR
jgi:hypothetical protein